MTLHKFLFDYFSHYFCYILINKPHFLQNLKFRITNPFSGCTDKLLCLAIIIKSVKPITSSNNIKNLFEGKDIALKKC